MKTKKIRRLLIALTASLGLFTWASASSKPLSQTAYAVSDKSLKNLKYHGHEIITVDGDHPRFSRSSESRKHGAWQRYSNLDYLNRAHAANALLNKRLMPLAKREPLYWDPTGWHNKRIKGGWLYNRCHLIGYQLTGQNNNPRNLITGTRELNDPDMLRYENQVATYIRKSNHHYVRYRVTPIYKGNDLLASGVEMEAQSIGDNSVHFNVYIFNEEPGVVINYKNGTSRVKHGASTIAAHVRSHNRRYSNHVTERKRPRNYRRRRKVSTKNYRVIGNRRSKIYHVASGRNYHISAANAVYFPSEAAARRAGYRKSLR